MALPLTYNVRSVVVRWKATLFAMLGIGLVVAVFVGLLAMASGFRLTLRATGSRQNAIVLQKGSHRSFHPHSVRRRQIGLSTIRASRMARTARRWLRRNLSPSSRCRTNPMAN